MIDWLLRKTEAADELARYRRHRISRVVWTEVLAGEQLASRERARRMIDHFDLVELDEQIATLAADLRHRIRLKLLDAFILATAQVNGAILVTRNTRDFPATMPGVRVPYIL